MRWAPADSGEVAVLWEVEMGSVFRMPVVGLDSAVVVWPFPEFAFAGSCSVRVRGVDLEGDVGVWSEWSDRYLVEW